MFTRVQHHLLNSEYRGFLMGVPRESEVVEGVSVLGLVSASDHSSSGTREGEDEIISASGRVGLATALSSAESMSLSAADGKICPDIGHLPSLPVPADPRRHPADGRTDKNR